MFRSTRFILFRFLLYLSVLLSLFYFHFYIYFLFIVDVLCYALLCIWLQIYFALRSMPLHIYFSMYCIIYSCICILTYIEYPCKYTFLCITDPCISHFSGIKEFLGSLALQICKLQVVLSRQLPESHLFPNQTLSFFKSLLVWG